MFDMEMRVPNGYVDRESLMGQSVDVRLGKDKAYRVFNGLVFKCSQHDSYRNSSYAGYNTLFTSGSGRVSVACMAHARRKFMDVIKASNKNKRGVAQQAIKQIKLLYDIEREHK